MQNIITFIFALAVALVLSLTAGCASNGKDATAHYAAQADFIRGQQAAQTAHQAAQKPLVEFEALEGQTIELKGIKRFAVYAPASNAAPAVAAFTPYVAPRSQGLDFASSLLSIAGQVASPYLASKGTASLVSAVGNNLASVANAGYGSMERLGLGGYAALSDLGQSIKPTITTTTTNTNSGNTTTNTNSGNTTTTTTTTNCASGPATNTGNGAAATPAAAANAGGVTTGLVNCPPRP